MTASGIQGPLDFALTAESQSQRGYDSIPQRETVYTGVPQGFRDRMLTLNLGYTPVDGTRLSLFLRADTAYFGYDTLGSPTYDDSNSNGKTTSLLGPRRRYDPPVRWRAGDRPVCRAIAG